jgi:hypothetical protein
VIAMLRDVQGERWIKIDYQTQSPTALRNQSAVVSRLPVAMDWCGGGDTLLCRFDRFAAHLDARLVPASD